MAKWNIVRQLDLVKSDLDNLWTKKSQKGDIEFIQAEIDKIQKGIIDHMRDKSKFDKFVERHIAKEVHPNADI
jgi:hypothetical protein